MKKTKVFQIIFQFSVQEHNKLAEFIHSPYFNKENNVTRLFDYILNNGSKIDSKKEVFNYLYPNEIYNDGRLRYLNTKLYNLIKEHIELEYNQENKVPFSVGFLKKLRKLNNKGLYKLEEKIVLQKKYYENLESSIDYQKKYLFEFERLEFYAEEKRAETKYIESLHFNLDAYYFIEKLKVSCTSLNQQKLYKTNAKQSFFEPMIQYIEKLELYNEIPLLNIYYNAYKMLVLDSKGYFKKLKQNISEFKFSFHEIKNAYYLALNFCIQQINAGNSKFNNEVFEMYQTGIEKEILLKQGKLSTITFSNVVTIGLRLKRYKEVEQFIENKHKLISGTEKNAYYTFNLAKVYFEKGDFEKVTALYNEKLIKEILLNIQMRILQIKAFYEIKEYDICESLILSTDQLLNRKGILAYHKLVFKNFIKLFKQVLAINSFDKKEINKLADSINNAEKLVDKAWLLEKVKLL